MRRYLWKMKPTDDYVRGYKDAKLMIDESLKKAIEYIKLLEHDVDELWEAYHDLRPSKVEDAKPEIPGCTISPGEEGYADQMEAIEKAMEVEDAK